MSSDRTMVELPETGYVFRSSWRVSSTDVDQHETLSIDSMARYLQEIGERHLIDAGAFEAHRFWVVRRTVIDVLRPIRWPDDVTLTRWCAGLSPRWCNMRVRIEGGKGGLVETEAFWINMNMETKGPSRMEDEFFDRLSTTTDEHRLRWKPWLTASPEPGTERPFALRHSDTDRQQHVNNAIYLLAVRELYPDHPDLFAGPFRLIVEYNKAITYGEHVTITTAETPDGVLVWILADGEARAHAAITRIPAGATAAPGSSPH
ncbi:acyl-[acyl-carrier-protein] thioesterase [Williamsia sterculiae]|uniref:Acyl-ACP thioesterase n=1 Tax=Williamsia sterculiae TaxID=1344003 RepID=A0A1N7H9W5_9NOCA|nr:acyl-ACP thioesterase domain-containing protein [Williamsia sterculiae]SIS21612.1 Acyl-ACP thioesterase [Williamsia sterculiae]